MRQLHIKLLPIIIILMVPVTGETGDTGSATESFFLQLPDDGIAITHGGNMALAAGPPGIALLKEAHIKDGLALLAKLRDANNEVIGFASELETFPEGADLLSDGVIWDTDWTVMIPGRGSLYLREQEHSGELGAKVIIPVQETGTAWHGDWTVTTTVGPRPDGYGVIVGGAGEFAGATGKFLEIVTLTGFEPGGIMIGRVELRLTFNPRQ
jgi:hypothetical protein